MKKILLSIFIFFTLSTHAQSFLDSSFGIDGLIITPGDNASNNDFNAVLVQPDNKIVAAGFQQGGTIIIRYNEDGTLDNTFATGGIFATPYNGGVNASLLQPDGKIIVVGYADMRLNTDGTLDNTFGNGGLDTVFNSPPNALGVYAVALQPDNKILLVGSANSTSIGIARLLPNGTPDSIFGVNGLVATSTWATWAYGVAKGVAILPDGNIVAGGETSLQGFIAIRVLPNGQPDTSFNHTGVAITYAGDSYNYCQAMQLQADGKIVLGGTGDFGTDGSDFTLIRYNTDGSLDRSYGDTGVAHIDFNMGADDIWALCPAQNGALIAAGYATIGTSQDFALARIDSSGHIDSAFGSNGRIATEIQDSNDLAYAVAMQSDGKIIAAGGSTDYSGYHFRDLTLARYLYFPPAAVPQLTGKLSNPFLYPNPTSGILTISTTDHIVDITAYDIFGNKITISVNLSGKEIQTHDLASGIYFFTLSYDDRPPITQKILFQNN